MSTLHIKSLCKICLLCVWIDVVQGQALQALPMPHTRSLVSSVRYFDFSGLLQPKKKVRSSYFAALAGQYCEELSLLHPKT